jgi:hypothetical protein
VETCDFGIAVVSHHKLNKLQGQQKLISDKFWDARAIKMRLKLFQKHLQNINPYQLSSCDLLRKDESISNPFQMPMSQNFKMIFNDICSYATNIHI